MCALALALALALAGSACRTDDPTPTLRGGVPASASVLSVPDAPPHHGCFRVVSAPDASDVRKGDAFCFEGDRYVILTSGGDWDSRLLTFAPEQNGVRATLRAWSGSADGGAGASPMQHVFTLTHTARGLQMTDRAGVIELDRDGSAELAARARGLPRLEAVCEAAARCLEEAGKAIAAKLAVEPSSARDCQLSRDAMKRIFDDAKLPVPAACQGG